MSRRIDCVVILLIGLLLLSALSLHAQQAPGTITGVVTDPSGAVIPGATVTATAPSGKTASAKSGPAGTFTIRDLPPGAYTVTADATGFSQFRSTNVRVSSGRHTTLNASLSVLAAQAQVNVQAEATQVSVAPTQNASSVSISGKDLQTLADDPDTLMSQITELAGPSAGPNGPEIYIDGFTGGDLPPKSAIREIRVNQNPFSAAYDRLGYGRVEILTKPGSEAFHGSGFILGNASAFNTASPFLDNVSLPPYHTILFGGDFGGPIGKKASFFISAERRNINRDNVVNTEILDSNFQPVSYTAAVPNPRTLTSVSPRFDVQLGTNNTLSARYHFFGADERNNGIDTQSLPSQAYSFTRKHQLLEVSDTQVLSPKVINETRFQFLHFHNVQTPQGFSPTIDVLGTFTGGGYSGGTENRRESHYEFQNLTTMNLASHYFQFGGFIRDINRTESLNSNFNGTFTFNSLASYQATELGLSQGLTIQQIEAAGAGPSQFNLTAGNPVASVNRIDGSLWAQDDWKLRPNITFSYGLRFETENVISDHADWAPRVGISIGLGRGKDVKTVLRAGSGIFYDRFDDDEMITAAHLNGINQLTYIVKSPAFFPTPPPVATLSGSGIAPTVYKISPNLKAPYQVETAASIERQLTRDATVSLTYLNSYGERQFLTNDINAPLPGTYSPDIPNSGIRPLGNSVGDVYEYVSQGIYRQNQIITNFRVQQRWGSLFGYYTFNDAKSDTAGVNSVATNPYNIMEDYGRARFAIRNRVFVGGTFSAPLGLQLSPMLIARSGIPFSITLGEDLFGTGVHNARPSLANPATPASDVRVTSYGTFDIAPSPTAALIPPNSETGPAAFTLNLRVSKVFGFGQETKQHGVGEGGEGGDGHYHHRGGLGNRGLASGGGGPKGPSAERKYAITITAEVQNLLNTQNLWIPVSNLDSPLFGKSIALTGEPFTGEGDAVRRIDLRLSFSF
jgi:Carboxypeptidase regulatory-like domain